MEKHVLILGAGLVSQPIIDYLLGNTDFTLTVADILEENAVKAIRANPRASAAALDVHDGNGLQRLISDADLVVSLLPYILHPLVAEHCLEVGRPMVNASYVSDELRSLHEQAEERGLLFLCEIGLDPGIDHMSAMKIIHDVRQRGGRVTDFYSVCGGLPAPEANNNPFGYKFSWSPKGVLLAGKSSARYIEGGEIKTVIADNLFHSTNPMKIDDRDYEAYPNRDSISYEKIYGFEHIDRLLRGTLRYPGWHDYMLAFKALNLLENQKIEQGEMSYAQILADLNNFDIKHIQTEVMTKLGVKEDSDVMRALDWLGLFAFGTFYTEETTALDLLADLMSRKMAYAPGERDMVILQHRFKAVFEDHEEEIISTLIDYGIPNGDSSMARTVSLPLAIAVKLILQGTIKLTGVRIPVDSTIYEPVLKELKLLGIEFKEEVRRINPDHRSG